MTYKTYEVRIHSNGANEWFQNGKRHRDDGPAITWSDGTKEWFQNDKVHREDGPAREYPDGTKHWYQNGKRHRDDGPAREYTDGTKKWYIEGVNYTEAEFLKKTQPVKELTMAELVAILGYSVKIIME